MKKVLHFLFTWGIYVPFLCVVSIIIPSCIILTMPLSPKGKWATWLGIAWGKLLIWGTCSKIVVQGLENIEKKKAYLFVANHQSLFDVPLIYGFLGKDIRWIMKKEMLKVPFLGSSCKAMGHIFLDRGNAVSIAESLKHAEETIERGLSVVIFPEGTRSTNGKVGRFKKGGYLLATELQVPIVPIAIEGTFNVFSRNSILMNFGTLSMKVHAPIPTKGLNEKDIPTLVEETRNVILSSLQSSSQKS